MTFQLTESRLSSKRERYDQLASQLSSLLAGERDLIANAANFSSVIFHSLPDVNWAGDTASNSEIVVPLMNDERFIGVLDLDSPELSRFDEEDGKGLEKLTSILLSSIVTDDK